MKIRRLYSSVLFGGLIIHPMAAYAHDKQPNIIVIMCDDLGYNDVGCYGQRLIETPNIDRIAQQGMRFTQA